MTTAPEWLVTLLGEHEESLVTGRCLAEGCEAACPDGFGFTDHLADMVWAALWERIYERTKTTNTQLFYADVEGL